MYFLTSVLYLSYRYDDKTRAEIAKYAYQHDTMAASAVFSRKLSVKVSRLSVNSMKNVYLKRRKEIHPDERLFHPRNVEDLVLWVI